MQVTYTSGVWIVKDGEEDEFVSAWSEFASWARSMPGCGALRLVRDLDQQRRFMSFAPWESFEAQRAWKETDEFRARVREVQRQVDDFTPSTYELVTTIE